MNILHRIDDAVRLQRGEKVYPHFVDLHTSNLCNMDCLGCAYRGQLSADYMPEARHFEAVDQFLDVGVKAFDFAGGGEPTTLPYLPKLMRYIADNHAHFALITNGLLLTDDLADTVIDHGTYCRISLEASSKADYLKYKQCNARVWDRVIANVRHLVSERDRRNSELEISLKFSVSKSLRGLEHYKRILEMSRWLGVDRIDIKALRHEPEELTTAEKFDENWLMEDVCRNDPTIHSWIVPLLESEIPQCNLNPMHTVMDWRGNLYQCCYYYYRENEHYIGNLFDKPFKEIWFSDFHRKQIAGIKREECAKVDCKFAVHHRTVEKALQRGAIYWL